MQNYWTVGDPKDLSALSHVKVKKRLGDGELLELKSSDEYVRVRKGSSRHDNTNPDVCVFGAPLVASHNSQFTALIRIASEIFFARTAVGNLAIATRRIYRAVNADPLGVDTPDEPLTPNICQSFRRLPPSPPRYCFCFVFMTKSPLLENECILLASGLIVAPVGFPSGCDNECANRYAIWHTIPFRGWFCSFVSLWCPQKHASGWQLNRILLLGAIS